MYRSFTRFFSARMFFLFALIITGSINIINAQTANTRLYLTYDGSNSQLSRTAPTGGTVTSTAALFKQSASVTSSGYFKTGNGGLNTGTFSSNTTGTGIVSSATTYTPSGSSRGLIVTIGSASTANNAIDSVRFGTTKLIKLSQASDASNRKLEIWYLLNPATTASTVTIHWPSGQTLEVMVGVTLLQNMDQLNPFGPVVSKTGAANVASSLNVPSDPGDVIIDAIAAVDNTMAIGAGQTQIFQAGTNSIDVASSYKASATGSATFTNMAWSGISSTNVTIGVAVKGNSNDVFWTMAPALCGDLTIKAGTNITIRTFVTVASGTVASDTIPVNVVLSNGGTTIFNSDTAVRSAGLTTTGTTGTLTWTTKIASDITIPAGSQPVFTMYSDYTAANLTVDYNATTTTSYIDIPTTTYVNVNSLGLYSAAYPGGSLITSTTLGSTVYFRSVVSNPFGTSDISGLTMKVLTPSGTVNAAATQVATSGCTATYEYAYTPTVAGSYSDTAIAGQGTEGTVTHSAASSFTVLGPSLSITKTITSPSGVIKYDPVNSIADTIVYNITVTNTGPSNVTNIPLKDSFNVSCIRFVSASPAPTGNVGGVLTWSNIASSPLAPSAGINITVRFVPITACNPTLNKAAVVGATDQNAVPITNVSSSVSASVSRPPVAVSDSYICIAGGNSLSVLSNDTDGDVSGFLSAHSSSYTVQIVSQPVAGSVSVNPDNTVLFNASGATENQLLSFTYRIIENSSTFQSNIATVAFRFSTVNNAPVATNDFVSTTEEFPVIINVLSNDTDADGVLQTPAITVVPQHGSVVINADKTITYDPFPGYTGLDSFSYQICDNGCPTPAQCATAKVIIGITTMMYACQNSTTVFSVPTVPGADTYTWTLPAGAVVNSTHTLDGSGKPVTTVPQISINWNAVDSGFYEICVKTAGECGPGGEYCSDIEILKTYINPAVTNILCYGTKTGAINLSVAGGMLPYTYAWTGPNGYSAGIEDIAGLAAGIYNVTVTDHYGCTATQTGITVTQAGSAISITGTITDENTYGTANGAIDITPSGGTPSYTYSWSNGATSEDLSGLYGGTYTVTVTDANGCTSSQSFTVNSVLAPLIISALTKTDVLCPGGSTGTTNLEVIGGTGSYTYLWTLSGGGAVGTTQDLTGLAAGTYDYKVYSGTDSLSGSITITEPAILLTAVGTENNISCAGANNGSVDATVSGGTAPYSYLWSNGAVTEDISGLAAGTYTLTATDANGCTTSLVKTITTPSPLSLTDQVSHSYCDPGNNGAIDITVSGGTPSYSYAWSNGAVTPDLTLLAPGDYSVVVTDGNGCTTGANYTIENNCLGIAKTIGSAPVNNGDGTYTLSYLIKIQNTGTSLLDSIQVKEDLTSTFSGAASFNVISVISGDFTVNPSFNGSTDKNLFASPLGSLPSGITSYVSLTVTVTPGTKLGIYDNSAFTSAVDPEGHPVADTSQNGSLTDPDSNGNPGDNDIPTPVTFTENPKIGVAKAVTAGPVNNGDGTYDITYTINVQNMGDVPLKNVQVTDSLSVTFPGRPFSVISLSSTELTVNPSYNGSTSNDLLVGTDVMPINEISSIVLVVRVNPAAGGIYFNTAIGTGNGPGGTPVSDSSNNGLDPDPDGDGNPNNNNIPTPVDPPFSENPSIGLAKALAGIPTSNGDGTYTLQYDFIVTNTGDVPLENVQVTDNLQQTFPGKVFSINSISSPDLRVNSSYNGSANQEMLLGNDTLMVGEVGNISLVLTVAPGSDLGSFLNQALASGKSFLGTNVTDKSHDGADVDPASDGPANDSIRTPVTFAENPSIGISKRVTGSVNNNNGTYTISYKIIVTNTGDVRLNNVQVKDTLSLAFADAVNWSLISITSSPLLTANAGFDGSTDFNMLSAGGALNAGQTDTISLSVLMTPGEKLAVYYNSATAYGTTDGGVTVNDISTDGVPVDPDDDNDPTNNSIPTPLSLDEDPRIAVAKDIVAGPVVSGGGYDLTYQIKVKNQGNVPLYNVQLIEDLSATFAGASSFSVTGLNVITQPANSTINKNTAFNGSSDVNLLGGTDTLKVGDTAVLNLSVNIVPGFFGGPYNNTAYAIGTSPAGSMVIDESMDGASPDPDNDGYGTDDNEPTPVTFYENPQVGLAKNFDSMVAVGGGNYIVYMKFVISNKGDVGLDSLKIFDDIVTRFAALNPTGFVAESGTLFANGSWNGTAGSNILADGQSMAVGDSGTVYAHFTATPGSVLTIYNTALAEGTGPMGGKTLDASTEGISTDPDGDGDPVNDSIATAIVFDDIYIIGFVYHDINALADNTVNGTGTNISGALYANLVGTNGLVIASVPVNAAGSYAFTALDGVTVNTTYTIIISNSAGIVGDPLSTSSLPAGWKSSGENLGAGSGSDGTVDGKLTVTTTDRGLTYANFGINMVPFASNDSNSTNQNTPVTASAATNDTASGDGGNTWSLIGTDGGAANGTVTMNPDGTYTYTPDHDYFGLDTFYYQVCDTNNDCDSAIVIITIIQVDDQPEANVDYVTTNEDTPIIGASVTGNDVPSLDGGNTYNNVCPVCTNTSNGALTFNSNGTYDYTPNPNFNGLDSFIYQICDVDGDCDTAVVYITINPVDDLPIANVDYNSTNEDTPITGASVTGNDVLSGDGGNTFNNACPVCTTTPNGTLTFNSNGTYDYTPNPNFNGLDSFIYQICDVDGDCDTAVVYITVNPVDDLPVAVDDYATTDEDTPVDIDVCLNDTSSGDGGNVWNMVSGAAHGTVTQTGPCTFNYAPDPNYNGQDTFYYRVCDVDGDCDTAMVVITITPVDDFPIANIDYNSTNEDTPIIGASVTGNDVPSGDGGNTYNNACPVCTTTGHGTLTFNTNGTYNYSPNANFNGLDSFIYQICDVDGDCDTARVIITIIPVDDFPVAVSDYDTTAEDTPIIINVCTNDAFSGDGGNTTYDISIPFNGNLFRIDDCHYEYIPNPDFNGDDMFSYDLCDVDGDCSTANVYIHVGPVDDKPVANVDYNSTNEDTPIIGASVTGNDVPSGDGGNSYNNACPACTTTSNGILTFNSDGTYDYAPNANFNGLDSFVYQICDVDGDCDTAIVYITINPVDDLPVANVDYHTTDEDTPITGVSVTGNDELSGDGGNTFNNACPVCTSTPNGTLTFYSNGTFDYTPDPNFNGVDSFIYQICDVDSDCDTAIVYITVNPVDDLPVAVNDNATTDEDTPVDIDVCINDTESGDGGNAWSMVSDASNGTVVQTGPCLFEYSPDPDFNGKDTFYYRLCDIDGDCDTAMVVITIDPVDDLPVAFDDRDTTDEDMPVIIDVCANDVFSGDGGNATVQLSDPLHGTLVQIDDCHYEYTPDPNYHGNDHFTYDLCDADGDCSTASVFIHIESVNDLPIAEDDYIVTTEETPIDIEVCINDTESPEGGNSYSLVSDPAQGHVVFNPSCTYKYIPDNRFVGMDTFYYRICDVDGDCDTAMVVIEIDTLPVSDCRWCNKTSAINIVGNAYGSVCEIPDIVVDVRLPWLPVDPYKVSLGYPATGSIQEAINYVNMYGDPTPGDGQILIGVTANDCEAIPLCGDPYSRSAVGDNPYASENVIVTNMNTEQLNIIGCSQSIHAQDPSLPVFTIQNSVGPVMIGDFHTKFSNVEGFLVKNGNAGLVSIRNGRIMNNDIGVRVQDNNVLVTSIPELSNNRIGILMEAGGSTINTISNARNNTEAAVKVTGNGNSVLKVAAGQSGGSNGTGIIVTGNNNTIAENNANYNAGEGILITGAGNMLDNNTADRNGGHGINADQAMGAASNRFINNSANVNSLQGIRACGQIDMGGNSGSGNLGSPQVVFNCVPASVTIIASTTTACAGTNVTFTATANNIGANPVYQWKVNGINAGTNASTYITSTLSNGDQVSCVVTATATCCVTGSPATSNIITMTVNPASPVTVTVSASPSASICTGSAVTFAASVVNGGTAPVYQWKRNGANVGSNSPTYANSSLVNGDQIWCVVTSNAGCISGNPATSNVVVMSVSAKVAPAVTVTVSPSATICSGTAVTFTANPVNGGPSPSYQWKLNGNNVGTNSPTFTSSTLLNGNRITCVMTTSHNCITTTTATSNTITMAVTTSVTPSVSITVSPSNTICSGTSVTFTARAVNGGTAPNYQWRVNGVNVGTNSSSFSTNALSSGDQVTCALTSSIQCVTANPVISNAITMNVTTVVTPSVSITATPSNVICSGTSVTFSAALNNGGATNTYQWRRNGVIVGSNSPSYTVSNLANGDQVWCAVTVNRTCVTSTVATSNVIIMTVNPVGLPSVTISASPSTTVCAATVVTFTAIPANGGTSPAYQWRLNGNVVGANSPTYTHSNWVSGDRISCIMISNSPCATTLTATSNVLTMTVSTPVTPAVSISVSPTGNILAGTNVTFTASPVNGGTPSYQWKVNNVNVGTNAATYSSSSLANGDQIMAVMTSSLGCVTANPVNSNTIVMSVTPIGPEKFITVDISTDRSYRYDASFNLLSSSAASAANADASDVCWSGIEYLVMDKADKILYNYGPGGAAASRILRDPAGSNLSNPAGITLAGDELWVADGGRKRLYRYSYASAFSGTTALNAGLQVTFNSLNGSSEGLTTDGTYLYVLDNSKKQVFRYLRTSPYTSAGSRVIRNMAGAIPGNLMGITLDGSDVYIVDNGQDKVYKFSLSSLFFGTGNILPQTEFRLNPANANATGIAVIGAPPIARVENPSEILPVSESGSVMAYPNPFRDQIRFRIVPPATGRAKLQLLDLQGRLLQIVLDENLRKGIPLDISLPVRENLHIPMIYYFIQGDNRYRGKLIPGK